MDLLHTLVTSLCFQFPADYVVAHKHFPLEQIYIVQSGLVAALSSLTKPFFVVSRHEEGSMFGDVRSQHCVGSVLLMLQPQTGLLADGGTDWYAYLKTVKPTTLASIPLEHFQHLLGRYVTLF